MKKITIIIASLLIGLSAFSQGIEFEKGSFEEALDKAKKENKVIFMDCYTQWCRPCKHLAKYVFTQEKVGTLFNENFVNVKMDMETKEGKPLMEKYNVQGFPTLLWLDPDGNIQHKIAGAGDAEDLISEAKIALDKENNLKAFITRFDQGERNPEFLRNYVLMASRAMEDTKEASDIYFANKKHEELINLEDFELIQVVAQSISNPLFQFVIENKEKFYASVKKDEVDDYLSYIMTNELFNSMQDLDEKVFNEKKKELLELDKELAAKIVAYGDVTFLGGTTKNNNEYYKAFIEYTRKYEFDNPYSLATPAWQIANEKDAVDEDVTNQAVELLIRSIKLESNAFNHDVYAQLLDKMGKTEEAKENARKAIELAKEGEKERLWSVEFLCKE